MKRNANHSYKNSQPIGTHSHTTLCIPLHKYANPHIITHQIKRIYLNLVKSIVFA